MFLSRKSDLRKYHKKRFSNLKKTLLKSPFYKRLVHEKRDFKDFPIMNKEKFMHHFDEINICGIQKSEAIKIALKAEKTRDFSPQIGDITVGLSSGTSGNKGCFLVSPMERAKWVAAIIDRVLGFQWKKRKIAFFLRANSRLYESVQSRFFDFHFFDLVGDIEDAIEKVKQNDFDVLIAPPSVLFFIAKKWDHLPQNKTIKKIISVAEVLEEQDRSLLEDVFDLNIDQVYQATEGFLGYTCKHGSLHLNEDFILFEKKYLDSEKQRFHPIITDLERKTQPIIRYELNDILIQGRTCKCGSNFVAIDQIIGRSDDIFTFRNKEGKWIQIFPDLIRRAVIGSSDKILSYAVSQKSESEISVFLEMEFYDLHVQSSVHQSLEKLLKNFNLSGIEIKFRKKEEFKRGSKLKRVRNECKTPI